MTGKDKYVRAVERWMGTGIGQQQKIKDLRNKCREKREREKKKN